VRADRFRSSQCGRLSAHENPQWFANAWCHRTGRKATDRASWLALQRRGFGCSVTLLAVVNTGGDGRAGRAAMGRNAQAY
jgi:hypothetical protein